jgi:hypothetical protein
MNRLIRLLLTWRGENAADSLFIYISSETNKEWCLDLCLLRESLIDSLTIIDEDGSYRLRVSLDPSLAHRSTVSRSDSRGADVFLSRTELDYWANFFLKYYRDGIGEVDHLDLEAYPRTPDTTRGLGIVLQIPNALPPISEEEARRRLGLS